MEFRINPECYHRMCKTCVDRIFKDGPNQCPHAGCTKTLRLRGFKTAFFGDLSVEREVDIRRRVATIFNKVDEDFETLQGYNDYLDMVECLTDDLVNGSGKKKSKAEQQLLEWEAQHKAEIERNKKLARESEDARVKRMKQEEQEAKVRRAMELKEEADEKASAKRWREEMLNSLQSAESGRATETMDKLVLKRRGQEKREAARFGDRGLTILGLKDKKAVMEDDGPYDPYGGLDMMPKRVDVIDEDKLREYHGDVLDGARLKDEYVVGGYRADEYLSRALFEAFSGLGVFVEEEKGQKVASEGAKDMELDDPF